MKAKFMGASPRIGYRNPESVRGVHSSGMKEVLVNNPKEIEGLKDVLVRVASGVGALKRRLIAEKAKAMKLRVVNLKENGKAPKWSRPGKK
jgi:large subunit ribosomal protein L32e